MKWKRRVPATLTGLLALAACTDFAHAQSDPTAVEFPMIGIGFDQTLQVNVFPSGPCRVTVTVYSATGEVIIAFEEGDPDKPLQLGNVVSAFPHRVEVRPEVTTSPAASPSACAAQATAEIFDNFTKTARVVAPGVCIPPGPTTMPIGPAFCPPGPTNIPPGPQTFGPVGLTLEQTARLNVVAHPPQPCAGTLGFIDPRGIAIIPPNPQQPGQKLVDLASGQSAYLDLTGLAAGTATGRQRPEIVGVFMPTTAPQSCIASLEVFERVTGWTRIIVPPGPPYMPAPAP